MKVGISTATFFNKLLTEDSFSVIKQCGGQCTEVFLSTNFEYTPKFARVIVDRLGGLDVYSVHSLNTQFEPQLFNIAERTKKDAETTFLSILATCKTIGAKYYTFHGQARLKKSTFLDPVRVGKRLFELGNMALDFGVTLCLENVHWAAFDRPDFFEVAKEYAPNIGATLDIKQARQSGYDWNEYLDVMGDRLKNVHISDCDKDGKICLVGKGVFPFDKLFSRLIDSDYAGPVIIEQYPKDFETYSEVRDAVEYLKKIIGGIYADKI